MNETKTREGFSGWCILELMGHRRLGGFVSETTIAGATFLRIDVPAEQGPSATQFYRPETVYALTPTTEEIARALAYRTKPTPVNEWELPRPALPAARANVPDADAEDWDSSR